MYLWPLQEARRQVRSSATSLGTVPRVLPMNVEIRLFSIFRFFVITVATLLSWCRVACALGTYWWVEFASCW